MRYFLMNLGGSIKHFRQQRGLNQKAFAEALDITGPYLSLIESNQRTPALAMLEGIAAKLEVPLPVLMFHAMEENDVPVEKRDLFRSIFEPMKEMIVTQLARK